jgi:hypothetical protein
MNARMSTPAMKERGLAIAGAAVKQPSEPPATAAGCLIAQFNQRSPMIRTIVVVAALVSSTAAVAAPPAAFLKKAIQGNFSEVTLGRIIQNRGASDQVRRFGAMLVTDHSKGLAQAQDIASRMRLRIPASLRLRPRPARKSAAFGTSPAARSTVKCAST